MFFCGAVAPVVPPDPANCWRNWVTRNCLPGEIAIQASCVSRACGRAVNDSESRCGGSRIEREAERPAACAGGLSALRQQDNIAPDEEADRADIGAPIDCNIQCSKSSGRLEAANFETAHFVKSKRASIRSF